LVAASIVVAYTWYVSEVLELYGGDSVADIGYQRSAVLAAISVIVLTAVFHIILAVSGKAETQQALSGASAIRRYARSTGGVVVTVAAVLAMALAMVEAEHFWTANVLLAGLVAAELATAGTEIIVYRRAS
jgi:hypothetical protein